MGVRAAWANDHPDALAALDVSNHAAHWARTQAFLGIVSQFFDTTKAPEAEARQRWRQYTPWGYTLDRHDGAAQGDR